MRVLRDALLGTIEKLHSQGVYHRLRLARPPTTTPPPDPHPPHPCEQRPFAMVMVAYANGSVRLHRRRHGAGSGCFIVWKNS